ncbi:hypothetical protein [Luteolibacter sp. LG18]|uniref:hypothetical protein n=1 Tax=Luteolibacter sp. LG18 TaxID=2819286 RepID=UPI0030C67B44
MARPRAQSSSNLIRFTLTASILIGSFLMMGMTTCGCHFRAAALAPTFLPLAWSLYLLHSATDRNSKAFAWLVFLLAVSWVYVGFYSNLVFLFR